jgi:nitrogen regulatory protein PII
MKKIEAIIKPFKLDEVKEGLMEIARSKDLVARRAIQKSIVGQNTGWILSPRSK